MSLTVISGPPGSGREGEILDRFERAIERDPLLVVPTGDDVDRIERALCNRGAGLLGGSVTSFPRLFDAVAAAAGIAAPPVLSRMQRVWLARVAAADAPLRQLGRSAAREGFAPALEELLTDLGAAGLDAASFADAADALDDSSYEREIAALIGGYEKLRDGLGMTDEHAAAARATAALRADPACWRERPVLLYGFDDLSRRQIELVDALGRAAEVTVAITFEAGRPALGARAELRAVLAEELGATIEPELGAPPPRPAAETLHHLERNLFEPIPEAAPPDDSLRLLEGSGERSEAELIGRTIARLLADGVDPDAVAVAVRSPDRQAPLLARVLSGLGIPVAAEARVGLASTSTGAAVLRLLEIAGGEGTAAQVVAFLRGPARARASSVDWLERRVLRGRMETAEEAIESWRSGEERDRRIWELDALHEAGDDPVAFAAALARVAASVAERPHERTGVVPSSGPAIELRAAAEIKRALEEAVALGPHAPTPAETAELLAHVRVPLWRGPTEGRVRILSPYRLRATRLDHLFAAGMTDGTFPARGAADPLLAEERRAALGLPARRDVAAEERYLFYSCVSRPERRLHLSYPVSDEAGTPIPRSPFVEEVRGLLSPAPAADAEADELEAAIAARSGPEEVVPAPAEASTRRELARALAAEGSMAAADALELPEGVREYVRGELEQAAAARRAAAEPGPLTHPDVIAALAEDHPYGASTLEEFDTCPYRWFVNHEIRPRPVGPDPEPLIDGGLVHAVLEGLYRDPPIGTRPTEETVGRWESAATELIRATAAEQGWDLEQANARIRIARFDAVITRFLRRDAATGGPLEPRRDLLEASFGERPDDTFDAAELGGFRLHGRIDRIDVAPDGRAVIRDYKLSAKVTWGRRFLRDGKLQMPLYLLAARGFGIDPIGGLYSPLGASKEDRPRGLVEKEAKDTLLPSGKEHHSQTDFVEREEFEEILEGARARAASHVAEIRAGAIGRRPRDGECPRWCDLAPVCRIERGAAIPDPEEEEEQAS